MTSEIREALKPYEKHLNTAKYAHFIRMNNEESKAVAELYQKHFGFGLTRQELNCGSCKLKAIIRLANDYYTPEPSKPGRKKKIILMDLKTH